MGAEELAQAGHPTRRTLIRAGAHAAWAAPVISVVAAAPSYAVSGAATLAVTLLPVQRTPASNNVGNLNTLHLVATITDNGAATTGLVVVVSATPTDQGDDFTGSTATAVTGFAGPVRSPDDNGRTVTFTYTATTQVAAGAATTFDPSVMLSLAVPGTVTVTALPGGAGAAGAASQSFS